MSRVKLSGMRPAPPKSPAPDAPWFVYLLECEDGSLYAGVALDVVARFVHHALGLGAAYTRSHPPRRILACRSYAGKGAALRAEYALKQLPRAKKLGFFEPAERLADAACPERSKPASSAI